MAGDTNLRKSFPILIEATKNLIRTYCCAVIGRAGYVESSARALFVVGFYPVHIIVTNGSVPFKQVAFSTLLYHVTSVQYPS